MTRGPHISCRYFITFVEIVARVRNQLVLTSVITTSRFSHYSLLHFAELTVDKLGRSTSFKLWLTSILSRRSKEYRTCLECIAGKQVCGRVTAQTVSGRLLNMEVPDRYNGTPRAIRNVQWH